MCVCDVTLSCLCACLCVCDQELPGADAGLAMDQKQQGLSGHHSGQVGSVKQLCLYLNITQAINVGSVRQVCL